MNPDANRIGMLSPAALAAAAAAVLILAFPGPAAEGIREALRLCCDSLIPALFPFLVLTRILISCGAARFLALPFIPLCRLLRIRQPEAGCAMAIGFLGGFAAAGCSIGALFQKGRLTARQAEVLLCGCACEGPAFVIAAVGSGMLGSTRVGSLLFCSLLFSSVLSAALISRFLPAENPTQTAIPGEDGSLSAASAFVDAVNGAVDAMLYICGFVLFFGLAGSLLDLLPLTAPAAAALFSLLEVSTGCRAASALGGTGALLLCILSLSALGLSAFAQLRALLPAQISLLPLALSRLIHFPLTVFFFYLFSRFLPDTAAVFGSTDSPAALVFPFRLPREAALFLFLFLAVCCSELTGGRTLRHRKKNV